MKTIVNYLPPGALMAMEADSPQERAQFNLSFYKFRNYHLWRVPIHQELRAAVTRKKRRALAAIKLRARTAYMAGQRANAMPWLPFEMWEQIYLYI
jgi:hypothetical protein